MGTKKHIRARNTYPIYGSIQFTECSIYDRDFTDYNYKYRTMCKRCLKAIEPVTEQKQFPMEVIN